MSKAEKRDKEVVLLLDRLSKRAELGSNKVGPKYQSLIETLFSSDTWGFRELLLVILIARLLNDNYRASKSLYDCNPRALYEGPIREWFMKHSIPHRKSGPLNIAKAALAITKEWAAQRRPQEQAQALVKVVDYIDSQSTSQVQDLALFLCSRFLREAQITAEFNISPDPLEDPYRISEFCIELIDGVPDQGNTAQTICGLLLEAFHEALDTGIQVLGHEDRASTTSTTSKKPGDITESDELGNIFTVYEVTTKPFGHSRVIESHDTLNNFAKTSGILVREILVLCRPSDIHPSAKSKGKSHVCLGKMDYSGVTYFFFNIYEWIIGTAQRTPAAGRKSFFSKLNDYISQPNTSIAVKAAWRELNHKG